MCYEVKSLTSKQETKDHILSTSFLLLLLTFKNPASILIKLAVVVWKYIS